MPQHPRLFTVVSVGLAVASCLSLLAACSDPPARSGDKGGDLSAPARKPKSDAGSQTLGKPEAATASARPDASAPADAGTSSTGESSTCSRTDDTEVCLACCWGKTAATAAIRQALVACERRCTDDDWSCFDRCTSAMDARCAAGEAEACVGARRCVENVCGFFGDPLPDIEL